MLSGSLNVLVIGSINQDIVVNTARFPQAGETLLAQSLAYFPGGKGANQAVAAARLGARVSMIGALGDDVFGRDLYAHLAHEGIDTTAIALLPDCASGTAHITVSGGENHIIVHSGANFALTVQHIARHEALFQAADVVLSQLEIPLDCVQLTAELAEKHRKPFILNPAPTLPLPAELIRRCTLLTPNRHEWQILSAADDNATPTPTAQMLITCGAHGVHYRHHGQNGFQAAFEVITCDSTGAGDTFNGALAAFWNQGLPAAVHYASAAAALSVTRAGAQAGMPTRKELMCFLGQSEQPELR
ncbi:MAG: ribokinase [Neisseria sp.]|nr:ribokinase [Neisseria sp.]